MKGILCTVVESSAASVGQYTPLGSVPTAIFLALVTLLVMLHSDVSLFGAFRIMVEAYFPERRTLLESSEVLAK